MKVIECPLSPVEMTTEVKLKHKYRISKPKAPGNKGNYGGNSGKSLHGTPPVGIRKRYRGKTHYA